MIWSVGSRGMGEIGYCRCFSSIFQPFSPTSAIPTENSTHQKSTSGVLILILSDISNYSIIQSMIPVYTFIILPPTSFLEIPNGFYTITSHFYDIDVSWKNSTFDLTSTTNIHPMKHPERISGRKVLLLHPPKN